MGCRDVVDHGCPIRKTVAAAFYLGGSQPSAGPLLRTAAIMRIMGETTLSLMMISWRGLREQFADTCSLKCTRTSIFRRLIYASKPGHVGNR
jgi:hypothetical protein